MDGLPITSAASEQKPPQLKTVIPALSLGGDTTKAVPFVMKTTSYKEDSLVISLQNKLQAKIELNESLKSENKALIE